MSVAVIDRNDVFLRGRLSAAAEFRTLPSGDPLVAFRLVVRRPEPRGRGSGHDTLNCVTFDRALQRRAALWQPGDVIEIEGALQRRFWRIPGGRQSVTEVNCRKGRKVPRPASRSDARTA